jgi:transcriptional regulator with GAF, ATPase, and Fis domain
MPSLKWIADEGRPRSFPVYKKITTVGRGVGNDITVDHPSVSDFHAQIVFDGRDFGVALIHGSEIGVNGKNKRKSKVFHGDRLTIGEQEFVFSLYDEAADEADDEDRAAELTGMRKLSEFNRQLLSIRSVNEQMRALLDAVIDVTHADKGFVLLIRDGAVEVAAARDVHSDNLPEGVRHLSDSILQRCIETRQPVIVSDALHDEAFKASESVMNLKLCSVMVAPLMAQGQMLGLIYVGNDNVVNLFESSSLDVMSIFAGQASLILQNAILLDELTTDKARMEEALGGGRFGDVIGNCASLREVYKRVDKVAGTDINVLITGETGTGKELVARELHQRSSRGKGPFVVVNCGAIPENLMESEFFGHVRGAFTGAVQTRVGKFQAANGGTLFLDEIGEMPLGLQVKLLRVLQERVVMKVGDTKTEAIDIRILAATNRDLEQEIAGGTFREDLYYRLNVVNLHLPPLRERGDDVIMLAKVMLDRYAKEFGAKVTGFTPGAVNAMRRYEWPGNVRQLENRLKKALVLADTTLLGADDLDLGEDALEVVLPLTEAREQFTRQYILETLERNGGNRTQTARDLGVDPRTIFRYLEREPDAPGPA